MKKEFKELNLESMSNEPDFIQRIENLIAKVDRNLEPDYIKLKPSKDHKIRTDNNRDKSYHDSVFRYCSNQQSRAWFESEGKLIIADNDCEEIIHVDNKDEKVYGTNNNKPIIPRNPYYIYGFSSVVANFGMYTYIYLGFQILIAGYLGREMAGVFGYPSIFWILFLTIIKSVIDFSIVALHIGKHYEKLIFPAVISSLSFSGIAILLFMYQKLIYFIEVYV